MMIRGDKTCAICFEDYKKEDEIVQLPCANTHAFHYDCLDHWISQI